MERALIGGAGGSGSLAMLAAIKQASVSSKVQGALHTAPTRRPGPIQRTNPVPPWQARPCFLSFCTRAVFLGAALISLITFQLRMKKRQCLVKRFFACLFHRKGRCHS